MNKVSLKLKVTIWYTFALLIVSFFILFAMTGVSRNVISKDIEKQTVLSVDSLRDKLTGPNKILSVPNHMLYDKGIQMALYYNDTLVLGNIPFGIEKDLEFNESLRIEKYNNKSYYVYDRPIFIKNEIYWLRGVY